MEVSTIFMEIIFYFYSHSGHSHSMEIPFLFPIPVKGVNFFGLESEYVTSGSDCGNVFLWDKHSEAIVQYMEGDFEGVVNCLEPHPHIPVLATSGLDHDIKIFSPSAPKPTALNGLKEVLVVPSLSLIKFTPIGVKCKHSL